MDQIDFPLNIIKLLEEWSNYSPEIKQMSYKLSHEKIFCGHILDLIELLCLMEYNIVSACNFTGQTFSTKCVENVFPVKIQYVINDGYYEIVSQLNNTPMFNKSFEHIINKQLKKLYHKLTKGIHIHNFSDDLAVIEAFEKIFIELGYKIDMSKPTELDEIASLIKHAINDDILGYEYDYVESEEYIGTYKDSLRDQLMLNMEKSIKNGNIIGIQWYKHICGVYSMEQLFMYVLKYAPDMMSKTEWSYIIDEEMLDFDNILLGILEDEKLIDRFIEYSEDVFLYSFKNMSYDIQEKLMNKVLDIKKRNEQHSPDIKHNTHKNYRRLNNIINHLSVDEFEMTRFLAGESGQNNAIIVRDHVRDHVHDHVQQNRELVPVSMPNRGSVPSSAPNQRVRITFAGRPNESVDTTSSIRLVSTQPNIPINYTNVPENEIHSINIRRRGMVRL
jgi:hypothetical protein